MVTVNIPSWINKKTVPAIILICLVAIAIIIYFQIPTPITPQLTAFKDALFSLNFDRVTVTFWALITGIAASIGGLGAVIWLYTQAKGMLKQTQTSLAATQQQAQNLFQKTETLTQAQKDMQANSNTVIKKIADEKQAAIDQAKTAQSQLEATKTALERQKIEAETLSKQVTANFKASLPTDQTFIDPSTGTKLIKVTEKVAV